MWQITWLKLSLPLSASFGSLKDNPVHFYFDVKQDIQTSVRPSADWNKNQENKQETVRSADGNINLLQSQSVRNLFNTSRFKNSPSSSCFFFYSVTAATIKNNKYSKNRNIFKQQLNDWNHHILKREEEERFTHLQDTPEVSLRQGVTEI